MDDASSEAVLALADEVVPDGATRIEAALAIQEHFRGTAYTYSLELSGPVRDENGRLAQYDPITHFLKTKTGYCVQFATGMVMLARAKGFPPAWPSASSPARWSAVSTPYGRRTPTPGLSCTSTASAG